MQSLMKINKKCCLGIYLLIIGLLATGCSTVSTTPSGESPHQAIIESQTIPAEAQQHQAEIARITNFKIKGRMGVQIENHGVSGNIHWKHSNDNDIIDLISPFGNKIADIVKNDTGVSLTTKDGKTLKAPDVESLTELTLGWRLPLAKLSDWIIGRPGKGVVTSYTFDEKGNLSKFSEDGWEISYMQYQNEIQPILPSKINLSNPKMNVRIVIENWDTSLEPSTAQENNVSKKP